MLRRLGVANHQQVDTKRREACGGFAGVLLLTAACLGSILNTQAAEGLPTGSVTAPSSQESSSGAGAYPLPFINESLTPASAAPGGAAFTLTVSGANFVSGATVNWDGVALATTFVSGQELTAVVPASSIASTETASICVANPGTNLVSNTVFFPVAAPLSTVSFAGASGSPVAAGTNPRSIAAGDFNGDGKLDLAVVNDYGNDVTILLGNGDGTFTAAASSPATDSNPVSVATGDFNGDGKLDLVVVNAGSNNITVLLGNGDGTFTPAASSHFTLSLPYSVAVADFNKDGKLDLAVANSGSDSLAILLGNGDGTFTQTAESPATGQGPDSIAVGDFDGDGNLDLAVANMDGNSVTILLGDGSGVFTPTATATAAGSDPEFIATGDFNSDGKLDLAVADYLGGVTILMGNGDGTFASTTLSISNVPTPYSLAIGDLNADGKLDLAVAATGRSTVAVLLGNGDGTFTPVSMFPSTGSGPESVAVGDFSGDGRLDLATANYAANNVSVLLQVLSSAVVSLSSSSVTFSAENLGVASDAQSITLSNVGSAALAISDIATTGDFSQTNNCGATVDVGASCAITVRFTPTDVGTRTGTLSMSDNATDSPQTLTLSGTGTGSSVSLSSPLTFPAQVVGTTSSVQTVTLTNTGNAALVITEIAAGGDFSQTNNCGATLSPGSSCTISVSFTPKDTGTLVGELTIIDNATGSPHVVALSGTGQDFTLAAASGSSMSASVAAGQSAPYTLSASGLGGFGQTVSFTCTGAPSEATCTVSPNPATVGSSAANITVKVTTTAASATAPRSRPFPRVPPLLPGGSNLLMLAVVLAALAWAAWGWRQPRLRAVWVTLAAGLWLTLALAGCGGGGGGGGGGGTTSDPGTPAGTYTLTVTGTAGSGSSTLSHSVTLTLKVS